MLIWYLYYDPKVSFGTNTPLVVGKTCCAVQHENLKIWEMRKVLLEEVNSIHLCSVESGEWRHENDLENQLLIKIS